jgi:hypothetical protein
LPDTQEGPCHVPSSDKHTLPSFIDEVSTRTMRPRKPTHGVEVLVSRRGKWATERIDSMTTTRTGLNRYFPPFVCGHILSWSNRTRCVRRTVMYLTLGGDWLYEAPRKTSNK